MLEDCRHIFTELRRRTYTNGTVHFAVQCITCGAERKKVAHSSLSEDEKTRAKEWDGGLQRRYWDRQAEARKARLDAARADWDQQREERRQQYLEYLMTPEWQERRRLRLEADGYRCQARLPGCTERATQVHHLTYEFLYNEPIFSLVSICRTCHEQVSEMEGRIKRDIAS